MILVDAALSEKLLQQGISTLHQGPFYLPGDCEFEPPCSLKWMRVDQSLALGAFSYAVSGYYFGASIGRYTSIGEDVQVGRGSHPVGWATTSPVFYQRHEDVVGFSIPAAARFTPVGHYIPPERTVIGNDVYIGHGAFIKQGVKIGNGAVVGAQSVVTRDVPNYAVVAGSPAKIVRMRFDDAIIERMVRTSWWNFAFWDLPAAPITDPSRFLDYVEARISLGQAPYLPKIVKLSDLSDR
jgi:acetyltransferase-like isoleucine patch superfamily enzyme